MIKLLIISLLFCANVSAQFLGVEIKPTLNQRLGHGNPYFTGSSVPFDANGALECTVLNIGDSVYTYYTGNKNPTGDTTTVCLMTSISMTGTQYKRGVVVGNGTVVSMAANCSEVIYLGGTFYMYAASGYGGNQAYLYTSTDGYSFTDQGVIFGSGLIPSLNAYGNMDILKDTTGAPVQVAGKYRAYVEANEGAQWYLYLLESTSLTSGWTFIQKLTTLQVGTGSYSGACAILLDGVTNMFYHYSSVGTVPTYLAYATASDGISFTKKEVPFKALESLPYGTATDQNADTYVFQRGENVYMVSEYARNTGGYNFTLYSWTYEGTFKQLITRLNNCIGCVGVYP